MKEAFGKFKVGKPPALRSFEAKFEISSREGQAAWRSGCIGIQRLLDHLHRYTKSESSREKYLRHVAQFSDWSGLDADQLVSLPKKKIEILVQRFADELADKDRSRAYVNTVIKRLRTFFRVNGYIQNKELNIKGYFVPMRYRKVPEYIPTKAEIYSMADAADNLRNRAKILALWSSGLRVSTLCALNYGDIEIELKNDEPYIMIQVHPGLKKRVADACKGLITYFTFVCQEASETLRSYIREREERYGEIRPEEALFCSNWNLWPRQDRPTRRLGRRGIGLIVKKTARLAGLKQWKHVTPHGLRKAFESVLRSPTIDGGRLDKGTQEFLMGHILPGSQDTYYDKKIDFHRKEYAKLDFSRGGMPARVVDKLIDLRKLKEHLEKGWMFIAKINDHKAVVRRTTCPIEEA